MNYLKYIIIVLFAGTFITQSQTKFTTWDTNKDYVLDMQEFTDQFTDEFFEFWSDEASAKGIIKEDFFKESYAGLDTDNDNMITDEEWLIGYNYYYDDYLVNEKFIELDVNNNNVLEYNEYYDVVYETEYFTDIDLDADNYISEDELAKFVFNNWDFNDNGLMSKYEFTKLRDYYLDI